MRVLQSLGFAYAACIALFIVKRHPSLFLCHPSFFLDHPITLSLPSIHLSWPSHHSLFAIHPSFLTIPLLFLCHPSFFLDHPITLSLPSIHLSWPSHHSFFAIHPSFLATHPSLFAIHPSFLSTHPSFFAIHPSLFATHPSFFANHPFFLCLQYAKLEQRCSDASYCQLRVLEYNLLTYMLWWKSPMASQTRTLACSKIHTPWMGDIVVTDKGLSYTGLPAYMYPMQESTLSPPPPPAS